MHFRRAPAAATLAQWASEVDGLRARHTGDDLVAALKAWGTAQGIAYLGQGARRTVFDLGNGTVVKFPGHKRGAYNNQIEAAVWADAPPSVRRWLVPVLGTDSAGAWLLMPFVEAAAAGGTERDPHDVVFDYGMLQALARYGILDPTVFNVSVDGRMFDYGAVASFRLRALGL